MNQQPLVSHEAPIHGSHNLVVRPPEQLVGRDSDLTAVHLALRAGAAVLLHGPSGVGKTALAAQLAAGYAELPGGVLWFDVAGDSFDILVNRVIRAYAPALTPSENPAQFVEQVRAVLHDNRPLIVLDGKLDASAAREFVKTVASAVPLLLTSEQMLSGPWTPHAVGALQGQEAEAMVFGVAGASLESYMDQIVPLCRAADGLPLSLYIAGRTLSATGKSPHDFLKLVPSAPPGDVNRALAIIMGAYRLLSAQLQGLVLLSGVSLVGGASVELLADVGGASVDVMGKTMRQLVAHGFAQERLAYGLPYFVVPDLIKRFATLSLQNKGQYEAMRGRYLRGLLTYLRRGDQVDDTLRDTRLALEMPTILAESAWAASQDQLDYVETVIDLVEGAGDFVTSRGFQPELRQLKRIFAPISGPLVVQEAVPIPETAGVIAPQALSPEMLWDNEQIPAPEMADALLVAQPEAYEPAIQDIDTMRGPGLEHVALEPLEDITETGDFGVSEVSETAPVAPSSTSQWSRPDDLPEPVENIERFSDAVAQVQADGSVDDELAAIEALAMLNLEQENYEDVLAYVDQGMKLAGEVDNPQREGQLLVVLGDLQAMLGNYDGAERTYKEAVEAFRPNEAWRDIGLTLDKLGALYADHGRQPDAAVIWEQALPIFEQLNDQAQWGSLLDRLGTLHAQNFHWDQALKYFSQALEVAKKTGNKQVMFEELWRLGRVLESSGARDGASNFYQQALRQAFVLGDDTLIGHTLLALGRVLMEDTVQMNRVVQLLEAAQERLPDNSEVQRLLKRARSRQERLVAANVTLLLEEKVVENYGKDIPGVKLSNSDEDQ